MTSSENPSVQLWFTDHETGKDHFIESGPILEMTQKAYELVKRGKDAWTKPMSNPPTPNASGANQPGQTEEREWSADMPASTGLWEIRCGETDEKPERVAITRRRRIWLIVHSEHLGETHLDRFHNGLTKLHWRKIA